MRQPGWYHTAGARHTGGRYIAPAHWVGAPDEARSRALCGAAPHKDYFSKRVTTESWQADGMLGELVYCQHCAKSYNKHHPTKIVWRTGVDATPFLTDDQLDAVHRLSQRYPGLRDTVIVEPALDGVVMVAAGGILLGIERDGHTHS